MCWRTADGAKKRLSVNEVSRRWLHELQLQLGHEVRWRTPDGAMTRLSVNEVSRRRLLELAAGLRECFGARLIEL